MAHPFLTPTQKEQENFLYRLYFGGRGIALEQAVRRAYQDLSRTVHGAASHVNAHQRASRLLQREVEALALNSNENTQEIFDNWHQSACESICKLYAEENYNKFYVGQAQKWINMTMKYIYVFTEERLPGYLPLYPFCHVPIDNIVLAMPEFKRLTTFTTAWSRISSYAKYLEFQLRVRDRFPGTAPLAVEFHVWQRGNAA